ncbi:uncharacterized protein A4U43_C03F21530 [Asparagus officinalis]|uniref:RING-type domain-containing protein n=1 Tax=Asparagus officinalis TaxID=4686 RepID=A0A5P1FBX1_ASPOF|nr:probable E3 ubiquitin-protein ligase RHY1A [Asparagus officinalis]ONK75878.1 uncharacterized protein A4U43_C03F21530 [Asparagus officinalis]
MTSAWQLSYLWNSRAGRSSDDPPDPALDCDLRRPRHRHRRRSRDDPDPSHNPLPRSQPAHRSFCHRAASQIEHESVWSDQRSTGDPQTRSGNTGEVPVGVSGRFIIRNNQLPDAVVQARERLVERLRGVYLAGTRDSISGSVIFDPSNSVSVDREDETPHENRNNLYEVCWQALSTLHLEIFTNPEATGKIRSSQECSICLDSFNEGDTLIRLHCGHRFHPICLQPWVRTCSDCPYCRANITC